ncbi:MAG TPA: FAD-binding oxidoreductase [Acidimicrobiales bacterium]|nr:FAD-binding oxidoreductase [Acidimicrobiales bacterium]
MPDAPAQALLSGWGRTAATRALVRTPSAAELGHLFSEADGRGVIARGLGRSYGDAAQCAGGTVVDTRGLDRVGEVDRSGEVEVAAGTSLDALLRRALPAGWFLPVTPGTRQVSVGGAIAADVHGKNHHAEGSFSRHVTAMTIATPTGEHRVTPAEDGDDGKLFWATAGGMGLTGIVTSARVRMLAVETDRVLVDTHRYPDVDSVMAAMDEGDARYRYSVAWVDCSRSGRAVLTRGDHARSADVSPKCQHGAQLPRERPVLRAPGHVPGGLLNRLSIAAFNEAWYRRAPAHREAEVQSIWRFFHPLDGVADWNRLYGPGGFLQYQFAVPPERGDVVGAAMGELSRRRIPSFLAVLKRFGPAAKGPLSFPMPGWTLALDVPIGPDGLAECLDHLDELVAAAGGRVYLAKDSRLRPDLLTTMYPRLVELQEVCRRVDPAGVLRSDLSRRLGLR